MRDTTVWLFFRYEFHNFFFCFFFFPSRWVIHSASICLGDGLWGVVCVFFCGISKNSGFIYDIPISSFLFFYPLWSSSSRDMGGRWVG